MRHELGACHCRRQTIFYAKADLRVRVGRLSVDQIADKILVRLKSCASLSG